MTDSVTRRTVLGAVSASIASSIAVSEGTVASAATQSGGGGIASEQNVQIDVAVSWGSDTPDEVGYTFSFDAQSDSEFALDIDEQIDAIRGFRKKDNGNWQYNSSAEEHRVEITQSVPESADHHDWVYSADSGAFVGAPHLRVVWDTGDYKAAENPLTVEYSNVTIGYGSHAGFRTWRRLYVGPYQTYSTEYDGQSYTLYVPALADDDEPYKQAVRSLVATADRIPIANPPPSVDIAVFPDDEERNDSVHTYSESEWAGEGGGEPEGHALVEDSADVDDYDNLWVHEFSHLEQGYSDGSETDWLREAQAEYFTATTMHAVGCGDGDLGSHVEAESSTEDDVLSDRDTWESSTPYEKGLAILSDFSARLHAQTDGETTMLDVFANMEDAEVDSHEKFLREVNETTDDSSHDGQNRQYLDQYVTTSDYPGDDNIDHEPIDRADSCLENYQGVDVTKRSHGSGDGGGGGGGKTPTDAPTETDDGGDGGDGDNPVREWAEYAVDFAKSCTADKGGSVSCGP